MISTALDYQPIDRRPVRWSSVMEPLSLQKRGLVHWFPLSKSDGQNLVCVDRCYRTNIIEVPMSGWYQDTYRGQYGVITAGGLPHFDPRISAAPLTITFWARHGPSWTTQGVEVFLGAHVGWHGYYTQTSATQFQVVHAENVIFETAEVITPVAPHVWHFHAAIFVSNSDRWGYFDGIAGAHNTNPLVPTELKEKLTIGNVSAGSAPFQGTLRDIRIYDRALTESELWEMYRNPFDMYAQMERSDDFQFFTAGEVVEGIQVPTIDTSVTLHTPSIITPLFLEPSVQTVSTALHAPQILADLGFQVSALTITVTAQTPSSVNLEEEVIQEDERELEPHNFKVRIVDYVGGDDLRISRTYTELPGGIIISKGYLTIKRYAKDDTDAEAILQKQITSSEGIAGQITDATTTGGSIELHFDLTGAETATLTPLLPYHYDVQIISQAGAIYTCEKGVIVMQQGVTDATS